MYSYVIDNNTFSINIVDSMGSVVETHDINLDTKSPFSSFMESDAYAQLIISKKMIEYTSLGDRYNIRALFQKLSDNDILVDSNVYNINDLAKLKISVTNDKNSETSDFSSVLFIKIVHSEMPESNMYITANMSNGMSLTDIKFNSPGMYQLNISDIYCTDQMKPLPDVIKNLNIVSNIVKVVVVN